MVSKESTVHRLLTLLVAELRLKLKADTPSAFKPRPDSSLILQPDMIATYACGVTNRYDAAET